jgi:hypothetical protein
VVIDGLVENPQRLLAEREFCAGALDLTLLCVLRVGLLNSPAEPSEFCAHWTSIHADQVEIAARLGL